MAKYLFADVNGVPDPRPELGDDGAELIADGIRLFELDQAVEHFRHSEAILRVIWEARWGEPPALGSALDSAELADMTNAEWQADVGKVLIRREKFANLSDEQFAIFLTKCREKKLNPWIGQAYAKLQHNNRTGLPEVVLIVGIEGQWSIANMTRRCAGNDDAIVIHGDSNIPVSATGIVKKLVGGTVRRFRATVQFSEYYPGKGKCQFWDQKPFMMITKCAESAALRKAFPEQLGGVYTPEEFDRDMPTGTKQHKQNEGPIEMAPLQCHTALRDEFGITDPDQRSALIGRFMQAYPEETETNDMLLYARVVRELRTNPAKWGVAIG